MTNWHHQAVVTKFNIIDMKSRVKWFTQHYLNSPALCLHSQVLSLCNYETLLPMTLNAFIYTILLLLLFCANNKRHIVMGRFNLMASIQIQTGLPFRLK